MSPLLTPAGTQGHGGAVHPTVLEGDQGEMVSNFVITILKHFNVY